MVPKDAFLQLRDSGVSRFKEFALGGERRIVSGLHCFRRPFLSGDRAGLIVVLLLHGVELGLKLLTSLFCRDQLVSQALKLFTLG